MIIAIDFDGTIVEHEYPEIGKIIPHAFKSIRLIQEHGHTIILWTFRYGKRLDEAVEFCKQNGVEFDAVNSNEPNEVFDNTYSRKIYADIYIDDRNILGIPDWKAIVKIIMPELS